MMYSPAGDDFDSKRNMLAGSLRAHRGRQKQADAEAMEREMMAQKEAKLEAKARAAAEYVLTQTKDQALADATYNMVLSGMEIPELPGQADPYENFDVRDKIYDDSKPALEAVGKTHTAMEILNGMVEKGYESGVAQIGAMYSFIKGIDPESVVRPSETDLVGLAESYIQQMKNIVNRVEEGVVTSEAVFNDLVELTGRLNEIQIAGARRAMDDHIGRAAVEGFTPEQIWGAPFAERYQKAPPSPLDVKPTKDKEVAEEAPAPVDVEAILREAEAVLEAEGRP
jgi:hypothetical protein